MSRKKKRYSKFVASATAVALVASVAPGIGSAASFKDVNGNYAEAVNYLATKGVNGFSQTEFGVSKEIKRVDAAIMLVKALGLDTKSAPASGFKDVPARAVPYINALKAAGITGGKTATTFDSDSLITRGELAIWIQKAYKLQGASTISFTDVSSRYKAAVTALVDNKITSGVSKTAFGTTQNAKRGDFANFLLRASKTIVVEPVQPEPVQDDASIINISGEVSQDINLAPIGTVDFVYGPETGTTTIKGNVTIKGDASGKISLRNVIVEGTLTVDTANASVIIESSTKVTGKTTIINVANQTFTNNGQLGEVELIDADGTRFINGEDATIGTLTINTPGDVTLGGTLPNVVVDQASTLAVEDAATVTNLEVNAPVTINLPSTARIEKLKAEESVTLNGEGKVTSITGSEANKVAGDNTNIKDAVDKGKGSTSSGSGGGSSSGGSSSSGGGQIAPTADELKVLADAVTAAKGKESGAVAGTAPGQYPQAAIDALTQAIAAADAVAKKQGVTKAEVDKAITDLATAVSTFEEAVVAPAGKTDTEKVADIKESLKALAWDKDEATTLELVKEAIKNIVEASVEEDADGQVVVKIKVGEATDTITLAPPSAVTAIKTVERQEALVDGQPKQVNDGKFTVGNAVKAEDGKSYTIALTGTADLKEDANPERTSGQWMGVRLQLEGVTDISEVSYSTSKDGVFTPLTEDEAIAEGARSNSFMFYMDGKNQEITRYIKVGEEVIELKFTFDAYEAPPVVTGIQTQARYAEGTLADGQPAQVNDGKFTVGNAVKAEDGKSYTIALTGTADLKEDTNPEGTSGQWMGVRLQLDGVTDISEVSYSASKDGVFTPLTEDEAIAIDARDNSFMFYMDGKNQETTRYIKVGEEVIELNFTFKEAPITYTISESATAKALTLTFSDVVTVADAIEISDVIGGTVAVSTQGQDAVLKITADASTVSFKLTIDGELVTVTLRWDAGSSAWTLATDPVDVFVNGTP